MFLRKRAVSLLLFIFPISLSAQSPGKTSTGNPVIDWGRVATEAAEANGLINLPIVESRIYAMTFLAVHDALDAIDRRNHSYSFRLRGRPNASVEAAVASAAHHVLVDQFSRLPAVVGLSSEEAFFDDAYARALTAIPDGSEKNAGISIGQAAAATILALRAGDGWESQTYPDFNYVEGAKPGEYRFTEGNPFAFGPNWDEMQPFALRSGRSVSPRATVSRPRTPLRRRRERDQSPRGETAPLHRARGRLIRPRSRDSGTKMRLCNGTVSRVRSLPIGSSTLGNPRNYLPG